MLPVCPKCDVALFILQFRSVEIDYCDRCRGVWLDTGELEQLMQDTGADAGDPFLEFQHATGRTPSGRPALCPRCDEPLAEIQPAKDLTLDRCVGGHGFWLDADELHRLLQQFPATARTGQTIACLTEVFGQSPNLSSKENHP